MARYRLLTTWRLRAPRDEVWDVLADAQGWPGWWPSVRRVEPISEGNADGVGRVLRFTFSTRLPYALSFEARLTEMTRPVRMAASQFIHDTLMREAGTGLAARLGTSVEIRRG